MNKSDILNHLESLSNTELPSRFYEYEEDELAAVTKYANEVVVFQNAGLDKLFESMSHTMKYIPNFAVVYITKRFFVPALAAIITQKLTMKQALSIGNQLPTEYIAEVSNYQDSQSAAEILVGLKEKHAKEILSHMGKKFPLKVLDIFEWLPDKYRKPAGKHIDWSLISEDNLHSEARIHAYESLKSGQY